MIGPSCIRITTNLWSLEMPASMSKQYIENLPYAIEDGTELLRVIKERLDILLLKRDFVGLFSTGKLLKEF